MKALAISERDGLERFVSHQALYSLISRDLEYEHIPLALEEGIGILPWSPLEGGFLSGKYRRGKPQPEGTRIEDLSDHLRGMSLETAFEIVDELQRIAEPHDASVAQAALNWLRRKPAVASIVFGARNEKQLRDNLDCVDWNLTDDQLARLDAMSKPRDVYPYWFLDSNRDDRSRTN
jgi:aryl-alcohol dehydrogenase-like predicted oxidoreductase